MKYIYINILLLFCINMVAQNKGNLLLLKIEKNQDLKIDSYKSVYHVIELDSSYNPLGDINLDYSKEVFFDNFTDSHLMSCIEKDSIQLRTFHKSETFEHDKNEGVKNLKLIEDNIQKAKHLMNFKINSLLYNKKIKISYLLINCNYCVGNIAEYDGRAIGYQGEIVLVIDDLKIDSTFELDDDITYEVIKRINFNSFLY